MDFSITKLTFFIILFHTNAGTVIWDNSTQIISSTGDSDDLFGFSVALNADHVAIGSSKDDEAGKGDIGSVSVYKLNGNGVELKGKLVPSDGKERDRFGWSVGLNKNNYVVVGSPNVDTGRRGKAHVYIQNGNSWERKEVVANDAANSDYFGHSVDINDNNEIVVGAWGDTDKGFRSGSAYVFTYNGNTWAQHQKLIPDDLSGSDYFGRTVSISNTHVAVGADGKDGASGSSAGCVYVYKKNSSNVWNQQIKIISPNSASVGIGVSFDLGDERLVVGDKTTDSNTGSAYVYVTDGTTWTLETTLKASNRKTVDFFGSSVSIHKHSIVVGAYGRDYKATKSGSAYVFQRANNGSWEEIAQLVADDPKREDTLGRRAVSIFNRRVAAGAEFDDNGNKGDFGSVYIFNNLPLSVVTTAPPLDTNSLTVSRNFSIVCHELYMMGIWVKKQFLQVTNISITLNDPSCNTYLHNNTHMWIRFNSTQCGTVITENNVRITQQNTATVTLNNNIGNVIRRYSTYRYNMRCEFERIMNISSSSSFNSTYIGRLLGTINETLLTPFSVNIAIYTNSLFYELAPNPITVTSYQPIYIGISESHKNKLLKFVVHKCFATPSSDINGIRYTFFHQKCGYDTSFAIISNTTDHFNFKIDAFTFIQKTKSIHIHCQLYICTSNSTSEDCQQKCSNKRKRRAILDKAKAPLSEVTLTTGEIKFENKISCNELQCPSHSSCINTYPAVCRCNEGYVLNPTTSVCYNKHLFYIEGLHLDMKFVTPFLDPTSKIFINFANKIEKQLNHFILKLGEGTIDGLQVVRARPGSVIIDLAVIYAKHSTKEAAYKTFVKSIKKNYTQPLNYQNELPIKTNIIPTMTGGPSTENRTSIVDELIIALTVSLLLVAMVLILIFVVRRKCCRFQKGDKKVVGVVNSAMSVEKIN